MAVDDEMAWEPRLPWIHPAIVRRRLLAHPSAQPVPERFEIVIPDLLATLTFDPVLGPNPRTRYLTRRPMATETIFDPVSAMYPLVWEPVLPTGTRRSRRELRRRINQSSIEPAPQGTIAAERLSWLPSLPTRATRRPLRPHDRGVYFGLEFSALGARVTCSELANQAVATPALITEAVTTPDLDAPAVTTPALITEDLC